MAKRGWNPFTELSTGSAAGHRPRRARFWLSAGLLLLALQVGAVSDGQAPFDRESLVSRAEAGDPWAQLNLGSAYDNGMAGFALDPVQAVTWYRLAAQAGLAEAQFNLAHCLATGSGTARNDVEALAWMRRAADQGLASAQYLAGVMYLEGIGTGPDRQQAQAWLQRAADGGNLDAAALLRREFGN